MCTYDLIHALRSAGLNQSEIARRTGIPQSRLSRWESGAVPAAADDALRLQRLYTELVGTADLPSVPPEEVRDAA